MLYRSRGSLPFTGLCHAFSASPPSVARGGDGGGPRFPPSARHLPETHLCTVPLRLFPPLSNHSYSDTWSGLALFHPLSSITSPPTPDVFPPRFRTRILWFLVVSRGFAIAYFDLARINRTRGLKYFASLAFFFIIMAFVLFIFMLWLPCDARIFFEIFLWEYYYEFLLSIYYIYLIFERFSTIIEMRYEQCLVPLLIKFWKGFKIVLEIFKNINKLDEIENQVIFYK